MRLFVGIALDPVATETLLRVREQFAPTAAELRWSQPESWHVTLQFLGSATAEQALCVAEKLVAIRAAPVPVRIAGLGFFERAAVFWAGVELTVELLAIQHRITAATRACGFVPENRAYNPHITLARARGRGGPRALAPIKTVVERNRLSIRAEFVATEFLLYESLPGPEGSKYEVRGRFELR
ncbi:MAG TPA: RNA 2',3'-cyclic phosphodiesterase [Acidobacteriaceae bacterium]|jgi:2'-5' RNA ligase|nr:RNA 2',3'-cyclic phosphodiesterase [Acidobacteriaceae bacterium]